MGHSDMILMKEEQPKDKETYIRPSTKNKEFLNTTQYFTKHHYERPSTDIMEQELQVLDIASTLKLPILEHTYIIDDPTLACAAYQIDRKLSVLPVIHPFLNEPFITPTYRDQCIKILRYFRGSVRALDDLLDQSATEPSGRASSWVLFGKPCASKAALYLWETALNTASTSTVKSIINTHSKAMLCAAALEKHCKTLEHPIFSLRQLKQLELQIREKELAYWRLVAELLIAHLQPGVMYPVDLQKELQTLATIWQQQDDVKDFEEDLEHHQISSFMIHVLQEFPSQIHASYPSWWEQVNHIYDTAKSWVNEERNHQLETLTKTEVKIIATLHGQL